MPNQTVDDQDVALLYSGPWHFYRSTTGLYNASDWYGGTFASCGGNEATGPSVSLRDGPPCELRFPFHGTYAALFGDSSGSHGVFSCRLETRSADEITPEGLWSWYDGGSLWWWPYQHNTRLCEVAGIPDEDHTLVLTVQPKQIRQGIAFDYAESSDSVPAGNLTSWSSDFTHAVPPTSLRNTTAEPVLPVSTLTYASAPSATAAHVGASQPHSSNSLRLGLGIGLGLAGSLVIAATAVLLWYFWRRRRRRRLAQTSTFEVEGVRGSSKGALLLAGRGAGASPSYANTLVAGESGGEKYGWSGQPSPESPYESPYEAAIIPASPISQYSYKSFEYPLPVLPIQAASQQRASYAAPPGSPTVYPPSGSPPRQRWSAPTLAEPQSPELARMLSREADPAENDLPPDAELDDPETFRER